MSIYTLQFVSGVNTITIRMPDFGYTTEIHMPIYSAQKHPFGYTFFDVDSTGGSDYRVLSTSNWLLTPAEKSALNGFFNDPDVGRCETVTMRLGASPTGFFPFGPDKGDKGDFTVRLLEQNQGGATYSPLIYFRDELKFIMVTAPAYTPGAQTTEGPFQIGNITGLMPPQIDIKAQSQYNCVQSLSRNGTPYLMDGLNISDSYETSFEQWCNDTNAAALVAYLVNTIRTEHVDITSGSNYYLFGIDNVSSGTYKCNFLGSEMTKNEIILKLNHNRYNRWTIPLSFCIIDSYPEPAKYQDMTDLSTVLLWQDTTDLIGTTLYQDRT
jgi:hypothetical protein